MTSASDPGPEDLSVVRSLLAPLDPVPDPTLPREDVLAARSRVGLARAAAPAPGRRGRLVAAGGVAVLSVFTLVALVLLPGGRSAETVDLATGPGAPAVNAAHQATTRAGTARGLLTVTHGTSSTVTAEGVGDLDTGAGRAEIDLVDGGSRSQAIHVTVIRTADAIYAKLPVGANPLSATAEWVSVDAATLARLAQMAAGDLGAQVTGSPVDALSYLKAISGDVQVVGPDQVRGEPTTRYRGAIDVQKVADQLPPQLQRHPGQASGDVGQTIPADLWLDAEGRLRKLVLTTEEAPGRAPTTLTIVLWDFGAPLDATPPPADQVVDVGGLLGGFLNGTRRP